jgi:molybdopterin-guanine dinucleotide biosynthesis protein A
MIENNILGVILAGGRSSRFGSNKADACLGNKTLLEHTIEKVEKNFLEILIVSNKENIKINKKNVFLVKDYIKGQLGPLIGILSAMKWVEQNNNKYKWIASFPCDTPFFDGSIIEKLKNCSILDDHLLFFLNSGKKRHNIFGLWSLKLINILEEDIRSNNYRKVELWADKIGAKKVEVNIEGFDKFFNINTLGDLENAKKNLDKI